MDKGIETFKHNELLDALRVRPDRKFTVEQALGYIITIPMAIGQLIFGKYRLVLLCDVEKKSISSKFNTEEDLVSYIKENTDDAFIEGVTQYEEYVYTLNVVPVNAFRDPKYYHKLLSHVGKDITAYMPIIQKFMTDALADTIT